METEFLKAQQAEQAESGDVGGSFPDADGVQPVIENQNVFVEETDEIEIFNPQKDLEFELLDEEEYKEAEVVSAPKLLTLS